MRYLLIFLLLTSVNAWACKCPGSIRQAAFRVRADSAALIVSGRVLSREVAADREPVFGGDKLLFKLRPTTTWKGVTADTLTMWSDRTSCGVELNPGEEYVFFLYGSAASPRTPIALSRCSDFAPAARSTDLSLLKARFVPSFRQQLGKDTDAQLNAAEAEYFSGILPSAGFEFSGRRLAFFRHPSTQLTKAQYFEQYVTHLPFLQLVIFSPSEKVVSGGHDATLVLWRKVPVTAAYRRQLAKQLGKSH